MCMDYTQQGLSMHGRGPAVRWTTDGHSPVTCMGMVLSQGTHSGAGMVHLDLLIPAAAVVKHPDAVLGRQGYQGPKGGWRACGCCQGTRHSRLLLNGQRLKMLPVES